MLLAGVDLFLTISCSLGVNAQVLNKSFSSNFGDLKHSTDLSLSLLGLFVGQSSHFG